MRNPFKKNVSQEFEEAIAACKAEMLAYGPGTEEWDKAYDHLKGLVAMRELTVTNSISPDMVVLCATHFLGIVAMCWFEANGHMLTTKSRDLLPKLRN